MIGRITGAYSLRLLGKGVECLRFRHRAIEDNLANLTTPGYKRKVVNFEKAIEKAIRSEKRDVRWRRSVTEREISPLGKVSPRVVEDKESVFRADGGTVDIDQESVALSTNTGRFLAVVEIMNREYRAIKSAIRETIR